MTITETTPTPKTPTPKKLGAQGAPTVTVGPTKMAKGLTGATAPQAAQAAAAAPKAATPKATPKAAARILKDQKRIDRVLNKFLTDDQAKKMEEEMAARRPKAPTQASPKTETPFTKKFADDAIITRISQQNPKKKPVPRPTGGSPSQKKGS